MGDTSIRLSGREVVFSSTGDVDVRKKKTGLGRLFQKITSYIAGDTLHSKITKEVGEKILGRLGQLERPVDRSIIAKLKVITAKKAIDAVSTDDVFQQIFEKAKVHEDSYDAFLKTLDEPLKKDKNNQRDLIALTEALEGFTTPQSIAMLRGLYDEMKRLPVGPKREEAIRELATLLAKITFGNALLTWQHSPKDDSLQGMEGYYLKLLSLDQIGKDRDFLFNHILTLTSAQEVSNQDHTNMIGAKFKANLHPGFFDKDLAGTALTTLGQVKHQLGKDLWRDMPKKVFTLNGEQLQRSTFYTPPPAFLNLQEEQEELGGALQKKMGISDELFLKAGRLIQQGSLESPWGMAMSLFGGMNEQQGRAVLPVSFQEKRDSVAAQPDGKLDGRNFNFTVSPDKQTVVIDIDCPFFFQDPMSGFEVKIVSKIRAVVCSEEALRAGRKEMVEVSLQVEGISEGKV